VNTPYLTVLLDEEVGIYTGSTRSLAEIKEIIAENRALSIESGLKYGPYADTYAAMQAMLGWSTIYEPVYDRVVTPGAGRWWNKRFQSYVLWGWDFTAFNLIPYDRKLAYANLVEILRQITPAGFFPNYYRGYGMVSLDRSQPPVYSFAAKQLYLKFKDLWLLDLAFDPLLKNNRWWHENRSIDGYLVWGSDPEFHDSDANTKQGAMFESGLDNSPMFDQVPFDQESGLLLQADVGLMSLYIRDCQALAEIATVLDKPAEAEELHKRAAFYEMGLSSLWSDSAGIFLNKRLDNQQFNPRVSPTNFYPLLTDVPAGNQVEKMLEHYYYNPEKFYGEYMLPSISRDDPAYPDQSYWRGRIWPPMNLLVYIGLKKYGMDKAATELAIKSNQLLIREYLKGNWIRENYHAEAGDGSPCTNNCFGGSDSYYTWGAVFGLPVMIDNNFIQNPNQSLVRLNY
jgi:neutral trehalase